MARRVILSSMTNGKLIQKQFFEYFLEFLIIISEQMSDTNQLLKNKAQIQTTDLNEQLFSIN